MGLCNFGTYASPHRFVFNTGGSDPPEYPVEEHMKSSRIKRELLLTTVALIAGISLASAQALKEGGSAGGNDHGISSDRSGASPQQGPARQGSELRQQGKAESRREGAGNHSAAGKEPMSRGNAQTGQARREGQESSTTGQGVSEKDGSATRAREQKSTTGQGTSEKNESPKGSASKDESRSRSETKKGGLNERNSAQGSKNEKSTTGQASSNRGERSTTGQGSPQHHEGSKVQSTQGKEGSPTANQPAQTQTRTPETGKQNQTTGTGTQSRENTTEQSNASIRTEAGTTINTEQQTRIQQSVLSAKNAPRVDHVDFAIRTNTVVPSHVRVAEVSTFPILVETFPRYREDSFFVVEDEIVIVDRHHHIVDVVPAGPRSHLGRARGGVTTTVDLSEPEIRELQRVLIERGFYHGRVDGVFGPEMRDAVITFQRKEGIEAKGSVDTRTITALGLSGRIGQNKSGPETQSDSQNGTHAPSSTTGQAPASQHDNSGQVNRPTENRSQSEPVNGQKNNSAAQQRPSPNDKMDHDKQSGSAPSTTGQGTAKEPREDRQKGPSTNEKADETISQPSPSPRRHGPSNR
jgi:peptidoglycan hydrolase-like protein with peptidoglycan-binding domain